MRNERSLRSYLATFTICLVLPLLLASLIATYQFAASERSRLEALANAANQDILLLVDREIAVRTATLEAFATALAVDDQDMSHFEDELRAHSSKTGLQVVLYDPSGQQLVNTNADRGSSLPRSSDPTIQSAGTQGRGAYVSDLFRGAVSQELMVLVAVPVVKNGQTTAILASPIKPDRLVELLMAGLPEGPFFATILDRNGVIVARSKASERFIGKPFPTLQDITKAQKGEFTLQNPQGIKIFGYYRRPAQADWIVAAAVEHAALTAPLARNLWILLLVATSLIGVAIAAAWWISRKLLQAQDELVSAAQRLGRGVPVAAPTTALAEANLVGQALAAASVSLTQQARQLQQSNQVLEERVAARTRDLAEKSALLWTTLDTINKGVLVIGPDGRVALFNRRMQELLGLDNAELATMGSLDGLTLALVTKGEFLGVGATSEAQFRCLLSRDFTVEHRRPDGTWLEMRTVPVRGGRGFLRTFNDVTDRHRHAEELTRAKEAAEKANHAKDEFLATMSHEMRTPLNAVIGFSDRLLRDNGFHRDVKEYGQRIHSAGVALLSLVDDILDLDKIEAGIIDVREEAFRLRDVVDEACDFLRSAATEKGLTLSINYPFDEDDYFIGDQDRIRQVLVNLINNAVKFTHEGGVKLKVEKDASLSGVRTLRFIVSDTGIGIAKHDQGDLFQRFHQLNPGFDRRFGGAGLGLAICRQLVERMGGTIGVESEAGEGAAFWFEIALPVADAREIEAAAIMPRPLLAARVLVAEDVFLNQELAKELLEEEGHTVDVVANGLEAYEAAQRENYDVILMDVSMPVMDGLTATRLIRATDGTAGQTPIVACTANMVPKKVSALREAGANAYLRKPLRRRELIETISRLLARIESDGIGQPREQAEESLPDNVWSLISLVGPDKVIAALDQLTAELDALAQMQPAGDDDRRLLADRAHAIISTASMLELTELAESCRELENACRDAVGVAQAVERLGPVIEIARVSGIRLKTSIERYAA